MVLATLDDVELTLSLLGLCLEYEVGYKHPLRKMSLASLLDEL